MLDQIARHGLIDLDIEAKGDLHIDGHHTVEDVGITLGQAVAQAVGDKKGITPLRPRLRAAGRGAVARGDRLLRPAGAAHERAVQDAAWSAASTPSWRYEFFQGFANHALVTLHIDNLHGDNAHHQCETVFKAFAPRAAHGAGARPALGRRDPVDQGQPVALSTMASNRRRRRLRHGQPALGVAGGDACRAGQRRARWSSHPGPTRSAPPSAWCCRARARCPTACASCATRACRTRCSTPPRRKPLMGVCVGMQMLLRPQRGRATRRAWA